MMERTALLARGRLLPGGPRFVGAARVLGWLGLTVAAIVMIRAEVVPDDLPEGVLAERGLVYRRTDTRTLRLDAYLPDLPAPPAGRPALIAIHGGGWRGGSRGDFGREMARFAQHGLAVFAIDYSLSRPGAPSWPTNRDDVRAAVAWVRRHAGRFGVDPDRVAALGASAGGHLAALVGVDPGSADAQLQAVVSLYGPVDLPTLGPACLAPGGPVDLLLGGLSPEHLDTASRASPLTYVNTESPPMLMIHGQNDAQVNPEQSQRMAAALARAGVPHRLILLDGAAHAFGLSVLDRDLLPEILAFLEGAWNDGRPAL